VNEIDHIISHIHHWLTLLPYSPPLHNTHSLTHTHTHSPQSSAILQLLAGKDQSLLIRGNTFLVLDLGLDVVDGVGGLDIKSDGLASEGLHENLHD
jgi:hypothetical protein